MSKQLKIKTKRLRLICMDERELRQLISACSNEEQKKTYENMLFGASRSQKTWKWYAPWKIIRKSDGVKMGEVYFLSEPKDHNVEVKFELYPEYQGKGYMIESLNAISNMAYYSKDEVFFVEAHLNKDDKKVLKTLQAAGFSKDGEDEIGPIYMKKINERNFLTIYYTTGIIAGVFFACISGGDFLTQIAIGLFVGIVAATVIFRKFKSSVEKAMGNRIIRKSQIEVGETIEE